jgi:DNA-binding MarR family transcriptional regulator
MDAGDQLDDGGIQLPRIWTRRRRRDRPSFAALHGAYHVVNRRMTIALRDHGLTASEAVVLDALRRYPMAAISVVRQATGLRASTLDSLLDRLVEREILQRDSPRGIPREVVLVLTERGMRMSDHAAVALEEVDEELAAFVGRDGLASIELVFEAARALGVPGTAADL